MPWRWERHSGSTSGAHRLASAPRRSPTRSRSRTAAAPRSSRRRRSPRSRAFFSRRPRPRATRDAHTHTLTHTIRRPAASHAASSAPPNDDHNRARSLSPERGEPGRGKAFEEPLVRERFDFPARDALQAAPPRRLRVGACETADLDAPRPSLGSTLASSRSTAASGTRSRPPAGSRARSSPRSRCRSARFCGLTVLCLYIYICVCVYLLDRSWSYMWSDIYIM